ncbi:MAG: AEC family transporter [Ruminococcaceae bacterium]|nr:AEC family transporter [Oscillospiraceae bacterium]
MIENLWICINGTVPIFLLVGLGILLRKWKIADDVFGEKATTVVFRLVLPVMIFHDIATSDIGKTFDGRILLFAVISVIIMFIAAFLAAKAVTKDNRRRAAFSQGAFRTNYAILGLPLTKALFGEAAGANATVILAVSMVLLNIGSVVYLEAFLNREGGIKSTLRGIAKNPIILAAVLGTAAYLCKLQLPTVLDKTVGYISDMCVPLSLITIGVSMKYANLKETLPLAIGASLIKTVVTPLLFLVPALLLGFRGNDLGTLFVFWASPSAVAGYAMTRDMGGDYDMYGNIILFSTLLSFLFVFFGVFILKNLGIL